MVIYGPDGEVLRVVAVDDPEPDGTGSCRRGRDVSRRDEIAKRSCSRSRRDHDGN